MSDTVTTPATTLPAHPVTQRGLDLLREPLLNKDAAFTDDERTAFSLHGLLPPGITDLNSQVAQVIANVRRQHTNLDRYSYLETIHDRNETLYYRVLLTHVEELTPIIYTPTVGQACSHFSEIFHRPRGLYLRADHREQFATLLAQWPQTDVEVIVVSDGSRILGLGDLGANGMGIPIGKLALYVLGAGIAPARTLPVLLDLGTNNAALRADPLYIGLRQPRLGGNDYLATLDAFIDAAKTRWPQALIQFEDFSNDQAFTLLDRYRQQVRCFNDDIQGTGAVTLAGILSALRILNQRLADQRIVFLGAGAAARGIADSIVAGMMVEDGLTLTAARQRIWTLDSQGLVTQERMATLSEHKRPFAQESPPLADLLAVIDAVQPTILIGVSGQPGSFNESAIRAMQRYCPRPIIFPLSNPTSKAECTAAQAYQWTNGAALFASGSPFPPLTIGDQWVTPSQCNNLYIFPGVGLGVVHCQVRQVTDGMFYAAARTLAAMVTPEQLAVGRLYPELTHIREISIQIAVAVAEIAFAEGLAGITRPNDLEQFMRERLFEPVYVPYNAV